MVFTTDELKGLLAESKYADIAEATGIHATTVWRLLTGRQEARESTLIKLTDYANGATDGR